MMLNDGYLQGVIESHLCERCRVPELCLEIQVVRLPDGIQPESTTLRKRGSDGIITHIGITCGCYAKVHRQVVHIQDRRAKDARTRSTAHP